MSNGSDTAITTQPHFRLMAEDLAAWLERQPTGAWWTVDGDPILMSRLEFPAPADELADELRRINRPLLASDPGKSAAGESLSAAHVDQAVVNSQLGGRELYLCWDGSTIDWLLYEDEPTSDR